VKLILFRETEEVEIIVMDGVIDLLSLEHARRLVVPVAVLDVVGVLGAPALVAVRFVLVVERVVLALAAVSHEDVIAVLLGGLLALGVVVDRAGLFGLRLDVADGFVSLDGAVRRREDECEGKDETQREK
jgi:hypothetical protein